MKKLLLFILLISSMKIFAQENIDLKDKIASTENTFDTTDTLPEYPGGISAFRKKLSEIIDLSKIKATGLIRSEAKFVITENGEVTDIKATGDNLSMNKELERSIKKMSKTKWKPAEIDGKPVRTNFRLPMGLSFE